MTPLSRRRRDDRPLLVRAQEDQELFGAFFEDRYEAVLAYFARRVLDPETAFDLMAETFASAFASLETFRGSTTMEAHGWLWAIARNRLFAWRERGRVEQRHLHRLGIETAAMSAAEYERAEELADLDRVRGEISRSYEALGADQREAVRLRVIEERPYAEIAERLGVTEAVVRARVSRGLRQLSLMLDKQETELVEEAS